MKRFMSIAALAVLLASPVLALNLPGDFNYQGAVNFDNPCVVSIKGIPLTATATTLNTVGTAGYITSAMISSNVVTNVLSAGMVLPAVSGLAVTNLNGANIAIGNVPIAALTNAAGGGLCVVTNKGVGYTNIITFIGKVSGTLAP